MFSSKIVPQVWSHFGSTFFLIVLLLFPFSTVFLHHSFSLYMIYLSYSCHDWERHPKGIVYKNILPQKNSTVTRFCISCIVVYNSNSSSSWATNTFFSKWLYFIPFSLSGHTSCIKKPKTFHDNVLETCSKKALRLMHDFCKNMFHL